MLYLFTEGKMCLTPCHFKGKDFYPHVDQSCLHLPRRKVCHLANICNFLFAIYSNHLKIKHSARKEIHLFTDCFLRLDKGKIITNTG